MWRSNEWETITDDAGRLVRVTPLNISFTMNEICCTPGNGVFGILKVCSFYLMSQWKQSGSGCLQKNEFVTTSLWTENHSLVSDCSCDFRAVMNEDVYDYKSIVSCPHERLGKKLVTARKQELQLQMNVEGRLVY